jgi:hypothetical protein
MQIFLFIIDGKPGLRLDLHEAQAALEDRLRNDRDVSDVWWDDDSPYEARKYLYGSSHTDTAALEYHEVDFETTGQLIWPVTLADGEHKRDRAGRPPFGEAELTLTIVSGQYKEQVVRIIPEADWSEDRLRPHIVTSFAVNAGQALADRVTLKERT